MAKRPHEEPDHLPGDDTQSFLPILIYIWVLGGCLFYLVAKLWLL